MVMKLLTILLILNLAQGTVIVDVAEIQGYLIHQKAFFFKIIIKNIKDKNISLNIKFEVKSFIHQRWTRYFVRPKELNLTLGPRELREVNVWVHAEVPTEYELYMIINGQKVLLQRFSIPCAFDRRLDPWPYLKAYGIIAFLALILSSLARKVKRKRLLKEI